MCYCCWEFGIFLHCSSYWSTRVYGNFYVSSLKNTRWNIQILFFKRLCPIQTKHDYVNKSTYWSCQYRSLLSSEMKKETTKFEWILDSFISLTKFLSIFKNQLVFHGGCQKINIDNIISREYLSLLNLTCIYFYVGHS